MVGALGVELAGRRGQFTEAIHAVPIWTLSFAVLLQIVALVARTEAWHICVRASGATVSAEIAVPPGVAVAAIRA